MTDNDSEESTVPDQGEGRAERISAERKDGIRQLRRAAGGCIVFIIGVILTVVPAPGEQVGLDYNALAPSYDDSRRAEPAIVAGLAAALGRQGALSVLEIGAGTGNYLCELAKQGFKMIGLEPSAAMLERGRIKTQRWIRADALKLPVRIESVDSAVAVNVLHHLGDLDAVFSELRRVVRRGVVLQAVVRENLESLWYRHYFPEIDTALLPLHPRLGAAIIAMLRAGFGRASVTPIFYSGRGDLTFESARERPSLLFDPAFREATSGFRRLSRSAIEAGLDTLRRDLESGEFARVESRYEADHRIVGDCVILCAETCSGKSA